MTVPQPAASLPLEEDPSADSAPEVARLRAAGPVARVRLPDGQLAWLPLRRTDIKLVWADPRFSRAAASRTGAPGAVPATAGTGLLLGLDPPEHTRVRRLVSKAFSPRTVEYKRGRIQQIVDERLDEVRAHGSPVDLVATFTRPLPLRMITEILGVPYADRDRFAHLVTVITSSSTMPAEEFRAGFEEMLAYLADLVARKRAEPAEDLLSELIAARDEGDRLSEHELLMNAHLILVAGHDTTANQLANSIVALFRHPDQLALLRQRPELIGNAVHELLRFVQLETTGSVRIATEDLELSGVPVRAGEAAIPMGHIASNDPESCADPRRLDLTRADAAGHMVFGYGPHTCPGGALARMELELALAALLTRFPDLRLAVPDSELRWRTGMVSRTLEALPVAFTK